MATLRTFPVVVEVWGWDEAFLGVTTDDPKHSPPTSRPACSPRPRLSCAVGIGDTRLLAKTATGFAKPGGVARLTRPRWIRDDGRPARHGDLGHRRPHRRPARATSASRTVADLARADLHELRAHVRADDRSATCKVLGLGGDDAPIVDEPHVAPVARSHEETFEHDVTDAVGDRRTRRRLASAVTGEVVAEGRVVTHVAVKVRTSTFFTRTKISKLPEPTTDPEVVVAHAASSSRDSSSAARCA